MRKQSRAFLRSVVPGLICSAVVQLILWWLKVSEVIIIGIGLLTIFVVTQILRKICK